MRALDLRRQFSLLEDGRFRLLFFATFASGIGNWLAVIALQIDVYDRTESGWWVGALLIANILPAVFLGLLAGPLVDRLSRKALMVGSDVLRLGVFVALPFASSATVVVILAALAGIGNAFFRPAVLAGLPNLVPEERLSTANALLQLVEWTTTAVGPIVGGAIVAASGPDLAYWVNAVTFGDLGAARARDPGAAAAERPPDRARPLGRAGRGLRRRAPLARAAVRPDRLVDRHGRDRADQRRRGVPRQAVVRLRRLRLRAALDGLRHRPDPGRARRRVARPARHRRRRTSSCSRSSPSA